MVETRRGQCWWRQRGEMRHFMQELAGAVRNCRTRYETVFIRPMPHTCAVSYPPGSTVAIPTKPLRFALAWTASEFPNATSVPSGNFHWEGRC